MDKLTQEEFESIFEGSEIVPKTQDLLPEHFKKLFGFLPKEPLSDEERWKCRRINQPFDYLQEKGRGSWSIFQAVYKEDLALAREHHSAFLKDVRTCPQEVLDYCWEELGA